MVQKLKKTQLDKYYIVNNTIVNDRSAGIFLFARQGASGMIVNNLFVGEGVILKGPGEAFNNLIFDSDSWLERLLSQSPGFVDKTAFDYRLTASSPARDAGVDPGATALGFSLRPIIHYIHQAKKEPRPQIGIIDVGAYEFDPAEQN